MTGKRNSCCTVPLLRELLRAIAQDDIDKLRSTLSSLDSLKKLDVINGKDILFDELEVTEDASVWTCSCLETQLKVRRPLSVAVVYQSMQCFTEMVNMGANLFITDIRGNNLLHLLIYAFKDYHSEVPVKMYDFILSKVKTAEDRRRLLHVESDDGLRPLDLAAKLCCHRLFKLFLYTEGVYREIVSQTGKVVTNRFTLPSRICDTERRSASFLWQLVWMDDTPEGLETINYILKIPSIQKLANERLRAVLWILVAWFMVRILLGISYLSVDIVADELYWDIACTDRTTPLPNETFAKYSASNRSENGTTWLTLARIQLGFGCLIGVGTLLTDFADIVASWREGTTMGSGIISTFARNRVENSYFYKIVMILMALHFHAAGISYLVDPSSTGGALMSVLFLNIRILICFSIMYFLQLSPLIGAFVIGFQKMLAALAKFAGLQITAMYLFATLFRHVRLYFCKLGTVSCGMGEMLYDTFLTMLNMNEVVPSSGGECQPLGRFLLQVLHVLYVFIVAVLTINYLIAIMSDVYSYFSTQINSVVEVHRICNVLVIERRLRILASIVDWLRRKEDTSPVHDTGKKIEVEEIDMEHLCMRNLRLGEGPFGAYCTIGKRLNEKV